tara:strand:+ start:808 stop:1206 length:399 start_codon:yes stop_codon:yes gene_type:complete
METLTTKTKTKTKTKTSSPKKIDREKMDKLMDSIEADMFKKDYPIHYRNIVNVIEKNKKDSFIWRSQLNRLSEMADELNIVGQRYAVRQELERRPKMKVIADRLKELDKDEIEFILPFIKSEIKYTIGSLVH